MTVKLLSAIQKIEADDAVLTNASGVLNTARDAQAAQQERLEKAIDVAKDASVSVETAKGVMVTDLQDFIAAAQEAIAEITGTPIN